MNKGLTYTTILGFIIQQQLSL